MPEDLHDLVAVEVGPDGGQLLLRGQLRDPRLQVVVGAGQPLRLGLVPGRAVGPGQRVQPGQQRARVGDVPADRRVGPLARRRSRGSAGAARPAGRRRRRRPWGSAARSAACGPSWPRPPRGGGTRPGRPAAGTGSRGLPMSCSSAASRSTRSWSQAVPVLQRRWPGPARSASAGRRPCAGSARRSPAAAPGSPAAPGRPRRCRPAARSRPRAAGPRRQEQLGQLGRIRSAGHDGAAGRPACVMAASSSGRGVRPSWATNRAARRMRSGSSSKDSSGLAGRPQHPGPAGRPGRRTGRPARSRAAGPPSR